MIRSRRIFMATLNALEAVDCVNIDIECLNTTYTTRKITVTMGKVKNLGATIVMTLNNTLWGVPIQRLFQLKK